MALRSGLQQAGCKEIVKVLPVCGLECCALVTDFFAKFCTLQEEKHIPDSENVWSLFDEEVSAGHGWSCCAGDGGSRLGG
jgi:hypothetical protein